MKWLAFCGSSPASTEKLPHLEHLRTRLAGLDWSPPRVDVAVPPPYRPYYPARSPQLERLRERLAEVSVLRATEEKGVEVDIVGGEGVEVLLGPGDARPSVGRSMDQRSLEGRRSIDRQGCDRLPNSTECAQDFERKSSTSAVDNTTVGLAPHAIPAQAVDRNGRAVHGPAVVGLTGARQIDQPPVHAAGADLEPSAASEPDAATPNQLPIRTSSLRRVPLARVQPDDLTDSRAHRSASLERRELDGARGANEGRATDV